MPPITSLCKEAIAEVGDLHISTGGIGGIVMPQAIDRGGNILGITAEAQQQ